MKLLCMRGGKTSWLFRILDINSRIHKCLYVNSIKDERSSLPFSSHNPFLNTNIKNVIFVKVDKLSDIPEEEYKKYPLICIDEANFYEDLPEVVVNLLDKYDMSIYVAGLNGSFERKNFGRVHELIPHVEPSEDDIVICSFCALSGKKEKAIYSKRLTSQTGEIVIGFDNYASVCRKCYLS